ncbi:MAG: putative HTH-type transcriptional regulator [Massilia sp.]|nr:putative HTH-type transcriptional regulator [Massilia sp.]MDB5791744.1 putative HTH-type transcriptional regulator [Massilia sp.]
MIHPMKNERPLDELDRAILAALRVSPQETNKALADKLGVSEVTIASRIRSLENDRVMKVMAQCDFRAAGYNTLANVDVYIAGRSVEAVGKELAKLDGIALVSILMGDPTFALLVMAPDLAGLQVLKESIASIKGVQSLDVSVFSEILKYRSDFVTL